MANEFKIRKKVGTSPKISPLQRAFKLKKMVEALRGKKKEEKNENVRRIIGRPKQSQD